MQVVMGVEGLTSMPVCIHRIGSCYGKVVQQAEAMAASWVIGAGYHPCGACMMPRRTDHAEGISHLHTRTSLGHTTSAGTATRDMEQV